jgi:hypothetical protein
MFAKKTTLVCATAVGLALGATSLSAQPLDYSGSQTGLRTEAGVDATPMRYKAHRKHARVQKHVRAHQRHGYLTQPRQSYGLLDVPFAAVEGVGAATGAALAGAGAVIGGTTAAVTGYPYWSPTATMATTLMRPARMAAMLMHPDRTTAGRLTVATSITMAPPRPPRRTIARSTVAMVGSITASRADDA